MRRWISGLFCIVTVWCVAAGYAGWRDAHTQADTFLDQAAALITEGRGGPALGDDRLEILLQVQDPNFWHHNGVDLTTPGAGMTTLTQSLAKRLGFSNYTPGPFNKIRQTTFALALDEKLPKHAQVALFLDRVEMGRGPDGEWITGFFNAAKAVYGNDPNALSDEEFVTLVSVMIAPSSLRMAEPNEDLLTRKARILAYVQGHCAPIGVNDVWLEGCA